ncbi:MAG: tRNA pseudouridine(38-40) synthase TruA [Cytophagaceae bacterium]|nr:tRNA pseudouridine(38-40) synthase TruA [Cytophagaceae bacterium]
MRYFIEIAYDGTPYHGWQRQPDAITVQQVLEEALSTLLRKETTVVGAGRTDTGVHAKQLFAHFDLEQELTEDEMQHLVFRLNRFLPYAMAVNAIFKVNENAHARFDAISRTYMYKVVLRKDPFAHLQAYCIEQQLDVEAMNAAAQLLLGRKDFQCFSRSNTDVKTYICDVAFAKWLHVGDELIFTIKADRFLRNMVRAVVGTLLEVGKHKRTVASINEVLQSKDRSQADASAPAHGLYLIEVKYPDTIKIL